MSKSTKVFQSPTPEEIAICAHGIYEKEGNPEGKANQHWLQAEAQLIAERKAEAGQLPVKARTETWPPPKHDRQQSLHRN